MRDKQLWLLSVGIDCKSLFRCLYSIKGDSNGHKNTIPLKKMQSRKKGSFKCIHFVHPPNGQILNLPRFFIGYDFFHLFNFYYCTKSYYVSSQGLRRYGQLECIRTLKGSPSIHVNKTKNVELKPSCPHRDFLSPHGTPVLCQNIFSSRRFIFTWKEKNLIL